jgi:hypothetical protein
MLKLIQTLQGASLAFVLGLAVTVITLLTRQHAPRVYVDILKSRMTAEELDALSQWWWDSIEITQDGELMIRRSHFKRGPSADMTRELFDLEYNPIKEPLASELNERRLPWSGISHSKILKFYSNNPVPLASRVAQLDWDREETEAWYFVYGGPQRGQGPGWFEGYDRRTRKSLGYLATNGLTDDKPRGTECFQVIARQLRSSLTTSLQFITSERYAQHRANLQDIRDDVAFDDKRPIEESQVLILSEGRVWSVDLKERTVCLFSSDTSVQAVSAVQRLDPLPDNHHSDKLEEADDTLISREFVTLRLDDHIKFTNPNLGETFEEPIPDEMRDDSFVFCLLSDGSRIAKYSLPSSRHKTEAGATELDHRIVRVDPDGTQESWITKTKSSDRPPPWVSERARWWIGVWQIPAPLAGFLIVTLGHAALEGPYLQLSYYGVMLEGLENAWPALVALSLFSGVLAWLADRRLANHRLPRSYVWLTFIFLFGLPGYIGFLLHRKWPVKDPVPAPERTGIEVFA